MKFGHKVEFGWTSRINPPTKMMQDANMHKVVSFAKISLFFACIEALLLKRATTRNALADPTAFQKFEVREAESIRQPLAGISH
jgi:hypothetical protein